MSSRVYWKQVADSSVANYQILRGSSQLGPFWLLTTIPSILPSSNFDNQLNQFFYEDTNGDATSFYVINALNSFTSIIAQSAPFTPNSTQDTVLASRTRIDENYGGLDALRYLAPGGTPISNAEIRIYRQPDYAQGLTTTPYAILQTRDDGRWITPVYLPVGMNYIIQFFKPSGYGPDTVTITV